MKKRLFLSPPHIGDEELTLVGEAFESNYIAPAGPQIEAFEREFGRYTGIQHAAALSSGTAAMHLALRVLGVGPGDEVIAPSLTFIGGVSPTLYQGATPVFLDSERISWNMDPLLLEEELEECRRRGTLPKAVISADIYGQSADLDRIVDLCSLRGIPVVSDSAEAVGAAYKGGHAGKGAAMTAFSFNGNKIITTSGGGMLASDHQHYIEEATILSQQARDPAPHYEHSRIGYNYRMSNILAAIGRGQLRVLPDRVRACRRIFERYREALGDLPGIEFMPEAPWGRATRWLTVILIDPGLFGADREKIRLALEEENIESRPAWKPMHLQPVCAGMRMRGGKVSEEIFDRGLCLPSGTAMTEEDLERVAGVIRRLARKKRRWI